MPPRTAQPSRAEIRESHKDSWIAVEAGDLIRGELVDVQAAWSDVRAGGSYYPLLTLDVAEATGYPAPPEGPEQLKVHAFGAVLYNEVERQRPEVGETITITYLGTSDRTPPPGQNPAERYQLTVHGRKDQGERTYNRLFGGDQARPPARPNGQGQDPGEFPPDQV